MTHPIRLNAMHKRPSPGQRILVAMRDGRQLDCLATMISVVASGERGIVIYHGRNAIDESMAQGWWPAPRREALP